MNLRDLRLRIRALVHPAQVERDLHDELSFHVDCETRKLIAAGADPEAARRQAMARFGPTVRAAEECRDARGIGLIETTARDVAYALRTFRRAPLVASTIVVPVALGLGLLAVVFTMLDAVMFREDAVRRPAELFAVVRPQAPGSDERVPFTIAEYEALRR